ncbi:insulin-like growth factor 1 receptor, partial [Diaphorina citri]|uniref:Tyrosine-protein kinase receptor n=1 Tax=Diaphorina citri TaxID=121845 RepID=A0A3Q0IRT5_DIACI
LLLVFLFPPVCQSIDVRNSVTNLDFLRDCVVIEGFLQIFVEGGSPEDWAQYSFPDLVEVTDYVLVYRNTGLRSLGALFPNLAIIRGRNLLYNYALVVYECLGIQELGLYHLTDILRGSVLIMKNPTLCFVDTVDWDLISWSKGGHYIKDNRHPNECPICDESCMPSNVTAASRPLCVNTTHCQKMCKVDCGGGACYNEGRSCCNHECIGGCTGNSSDKCIGCRHLEFDGSCVEACPATAFNFINRRCVTNDECQAQPPPVNSDSGKQFALVVLDNANLMELWDWNKRNLSLHIQNGRIFFHFNPKLCYYHIKNLATKAGVTSLTDTEVPKSSNGDKAACNISWINATITNIQPYIVTVQWNKFDHYDSRALLSYLIFYKETNHRNVTIYDGRDACGGDGWKMEEIENADNKASSSLNETEHETTDPCIQIIPNLKPFTQYAYYVRTYTIATERNGAQSPIQYFLTKPNTPSVPRELIATPLSSSEIEISWKPPEKPNGNVTHYYIVGSWERDDPMIIETRNYCQEPVILTGSGGPAVTTTTVATPTTPAGGTTTPPNQLMGGDDDKCECETRYGKSEDVREKENNRRIEIEFENTLQDQVYVKSSDESDDQLVHFDHLRAGARLFRGYAFKSVKFRGYAFKSVKFRGYAFKSVKFRGYAFKSVKFRGYAFKSVKFRGYAFKSVKFRGYAFKSVKFRGYAFKSVKFRGYAFKSVKFRGYAFKSVKFRGYAFKSVKFRGYAFKSVKFRGYAFKSVKFRGYAFKSVKFRGYAFKSVKFRGYAFKSVKFRGYAFKSVKFRGYAFKSVKFRGYAFKSVKFRGYAFKSVKFRGYAFKSVKFRGYAFKSVKFRGYAFKSVKFRGYAFKSVKFRGYAFKSVKFRGYAFKSVKFRGYAFKSVKFRGYAFKSVKFRGYAFKSVKFRGYAFKSVKFRGYAFKSVKFRGYAFKSVKFRGYAFKSVKFRGYAFKSVKFRGYAFKSVKFRGYAFEFVKFRGYAFEFVKFRGYAFKLAELCSEKHDFGTWSSGRDFILNFSPLIVSVYKKDSWEVLRSKVTILDELGNGSFGLVYRGLIKDFRSLAEHPCAIKVANENASEREKAEFLNEASVMKAFDTHHVVKLYGVVSEGNPTLVIMELMGGGDLKNYLRSCRPDAETDVERSPPTLSRILQMAAEVADGMAYLADKKFVHRDLAARNCMVADDLTVKVGDFGMTRDIYETEYYRKGSRGFLPVRWMAPESLKDGVFTSHSDVWSYGVVLWEMATLASQPYQGLSNEQVLNWVKGGGILVRPDNCPDRLFNLMRRCWQFKPQARPTFMEILADLERDIAASFRQVSYYHSAACAENKLRLAAKAETRTSSTTLDEQIPLRSAEDIEDFSLSSDSNEEDNNPALEEDDRGVMKYRNNAGKFKSYIICPTNQKPVISHMEVIIICFLVLILVVVLIFLSNHLQKPVISHMEVIIICFLVLILVVVLIFL